MISVRLTVSRDTTARARRRFSRDRPSHRRAILDRLRLGEQPVLALAEPFDMTLPAVSQQLRILRHAGLVTERRVGRQRVYRLNHEPLREVRDWMRHYEKFWTRKLHRL